jgi:hypothetical protein
MDKLHFEGILHTINSVLRRMVEVEFSQVIVYTLENQLVMLKPGPTHLQCVTVVGYLQWLRECVLHIQ